MKQKKDMTLIKVMVEQTGVIMAVPQSYYDAYSNAGLRHLGPWVDEEAPVSKPEGEAPAAPMTHKELVDACTLKGLTFKGNASKEELKELLASVEE